MRVPLANDTVPGKISFKIAESQADPLIAKRSLHGDSSIVYSNDSDFLVHNPNCVQIFKSTINKNGTATKDFVLATGSKQSADNVQAILRKKYPDIYGNQVIFVEVAENKIFEHEPDFICRGLLACADGQCCRWSQIVEMC